MKKILVCYVSRTGNTEKMAEYIGEGIRFAGHTADVRKITDINDDQQLSGYDAYILGCPTYHRDLTNGMKQFLFKMEKMNLVGKMGGAFCSYTHSGESGTMIYETMQFVYKMDMIDLGALNLKESQLESDEGHKACQQYGRALGQKLES